MCENVKDVFGAERTKQLRDGLLTKISHIVIKSVMKV